MCSRAVYRVAFVGYGHNNAFLWQSPGAFSHVRDAEDGLNPL